MSFGNHQYQHRYFRDEPHKKYIQELNQSYAAHPLNYSTNVEPDYYSPQVKTQKQPLTNKLNIRVRAP